MFSNFIRGLLILNRYYDNGDGDHIGAEHDAFYAYTTNRSLSVEDVTKMVDWGWHQEDVSIPDNEDFSAEHYDPEVGWVYNI